MLAGSYSTPFGSKGGHLHIQLYGNPLDLPIACKSSGGCYPAEAVGKGCLHRKGFVKTDPCQATITPKQYNSYFEGYEDLYSYGGYFGRKVLAVSYGGSLKLFGAKGVEKNKRVDNDPSPKKVRSCNIPRPADQSNIDKWAAETGISWVRLNADVQEGRTELVLDRDVNWSPNDLIVIGTTDWHVGHSELSTIRSVNANQISLSTPLKYNHNGKPYTVPPSSKLTSPNNNAQLEVEMRAAVGLLSRSITIESLGSTSTDAFPAANECGLPQQILTPNPSCYFGAHLIVRQGFADFQIQGVEFLHMGQGGAIGTYPVHFHLVKDASYTNTFVRDSSIWDSNTRFITIHGSHGIELSRNVGYLSMGHAYYLEDGSEINNVLCQNLGITARAAFMDYFNGTASDSPEHRYIPPILNAMNDGSVQGSDAAYPTMFWMMNTYNEFVGNQAVGVQGFGVCYWPLSSSVSGPSMRLHWASGSNSDADYANYNVQGARQAPLKRFRGNGCTTAPYAFMSERQSLTPNTTLISKPLSDASANLGQPLVVLQNTDEATQQASKPQVASNFYPTFHPTKGNPNPNCSSQPTGTNVNNASCAASIIDRLTTSFNWAQTNFGSIWLRPWSWVVINSAITDQLFGGLGFVSGGSWNQTLPQQLAIVKNSIFVGSVNPSDQNSGQHGPTILASSPPSSNPFMNSECTSSGGYCFLPSDGTGVYMGGINPKRMITIYDGPFFSDTNVFTRIQDETIDIPSEYIYDSTNQIASSENGSNVLSYTVANAAIGWKQTNGFYYPPVFAFKNTSFDMDSIRHNVLDENILYSSGTAAPGQSVTYTVTDMGATSIDATTILNDLDGSLNGLIPSFNSPFPKKSANKTSGLSNNPFYDVPISVGQCNSIGTQTVPHEFVSTIISRLSQINSSSWETDGNWGAGEPAVAVYRQLITNSTGDFCWSKQKVCLPGETDCCRRGTFFVGTQTGSAPGLTMNNGTYYIDTVLPSSYQTQPNIGQLVNFAADNTYAVFNLYGNTRTTVTYQIYVGTDFSIADNFRWVLANPHVNEGGNGIQINDLNGTPTASSAVGLDENGILTVVLSHEGYRNYAKINSSEPCYPANLCSAKENNTMGSQKTSCVVSKKFKEVGLQDDINSICNYWVTRTSREGADGVFLSDCPQGGCLGFRFTLPSDFEPPSTPDGILNFVLPGKYASCYKREKPWTIGLLQVPSSNATCPVPTSENFCGE